MNINTKGMSTHEVFGYETEKEMMDMLMDEEYTEVNRKEVSLIVMMMKLQELGIEPTILVITVLNAVTGLTIKGPSELMEYFSKALSEEEIIIMSGKITKIGGEDFNYIIKEAKVLFDAMKAMKS